MVGCGMTPLQSNHASDQARYLCYTYDDPAQHVLTLPVPGNGAEESPVEIWFQGSILLAIYQPHDLTRRWIFDADGSYVQVDSDKNALYWDFKGANEGEKRKAKSVFKCKARLEDVTIERRTRQALP
jgi:hypothetical protein